MTARAEGSRWLPELWEHDLWRRGAGLVVAILLLTSTVLPHIALEGAGGPRSLLPTALYFLNVDASAAVGLAVNQALLGSGFNVAYLGLGLQQLGLALAAVSVWIVFGGDEVNRWLWRMMVVAAWMLALSGPLVLLGWFLIESSGVPALLGVAWLAALAAGALLLVLARQSREHRDFTWYVTKPELM